MTDRKLDITTPDDTTLVVIRDFDAPPALLFEAHTRPELVKRWLLGPDGWSMPVCDIDFRVGGRFRYTWKSDATGEEFGLGGEYREIERPSRIRHTERFEPDWTGGDTDCVVVFEDLGQGRTRMVQSVAYNSPEAMAGALKTGMIDGMTTTYDRLARMIADGAVAA